MTRRFLEWLTQRWDKRPISADLAQDYRATFSTPSGQRVLKHLLDNIYCRAYEGMDATAAVIHNARRTVLQEILENIDQGEGVKPVPVDKGDLTHA